MYEYFEIKKFDECSLYHWDKFCLKSDDAWLWHTSYGILSKSCWLNHFNQSFKQLIRVKKKNKAEEKTLEYQKSFVKELERRNNK